MAKPKIMAKTPDSSDTNALVEAHEDILADPKARRYAIVELAVPEIIVHTGGDSIARVQLTHIELMTGADESAAVKLLDKVFSARTHIASRPGPEAEDTPLDMSGVGSLIE